MTAAAVFLAIAAVHSGSGLTGLYLAVEIAVAFAVLGGTVFALGKVLRRFVRRVGNFLDDWGGTEARSGVPARPGVMERMDCQDRQLADISRRVAGVEGELHANGGTTVKDAVHSIDAVTRGLAERMERMERWAANHDPGA